ncbi:MAG: homoserine kinase [Actinobacteria bacterium]|nr:homoserine kinase [Actinomycetota bacterium]
MAAPAGARPVRPGIHVRVPATSANLGAGFDSLGLALAMYDHLSVHVTERPGITLRLHGEGSQTLHRDGRHLVAKVITELAARDGFELPGLVIIAKNRIPQRRGLGSSAAAVVAAVAVYHALRADGPVDHAQMLRDASLFEGHPDNIAACIYGGVTVAWVNDGVAGAESVAPAPGLAAVLAVPKVNSSTARARKVLPETVPYADAVFNIAHTNMTLLALTQRPHLLSQAMADRMHERQRRSGWPASWALLKQLRSAGLAAAISGAGSSVIVLHDGSDVATVARAVRAASADKFAVRRAEVDTNGVVIERVTESAPRQRSPKR